MIYSVFVEGTLCYDKSNEDDDSSLCSDEATSPCNPHVQFLSDNSCTKTESNIFSPFSKNYTCPPPPDIQPLLQKLKQQQASISTALSAASVVTVSTGSFGTKKPFTLTSSITPVRSTTGVVTFPPSIASFSSFSSSAKSASSVIKSARYKKLSKSKTSLSKNKTIKFHEYKGPPSVSKVNTDEEDHTPYHLMLQQQQLFLQWQLEVQKTGGNTTNILPVNVPFAISGQKMPHSTGSSMSTTTIPTAQIIAQASPTRGPVTPPLTTVISPHNLIGASTTGSVAHTLGTLSPTVGISSQTLGNHSLTDTVTKFTAVRHNTPPTGIVRPQKIITSSLPPQQLITAAIPPQLQTGAFTIQKQVTAVVPTWEKKHTAPIHLQVTACTPQPPPAPPLPPNNKTALQPRAKCLEEMKVAELKVELKKRSLTVSGSKPQLIEKLRPYIDSIFGASKVLTSTSNLVLTVNGSSGISSPGSSICGPPSNNPSLPSPASVKSVSSYGNVINIQPISPPSMTGSDDQLILSSGVISSPPLSPMSVLAPGSTITAVAANSSAILSNPNGNISNIDLNNSYGSLPSVPAYSPSDSNSMDVPSPPTLSMVTQSALSNSSMQAMLVDQQSRPPSVAPMDVETPHAGAPTSLVTPPVAPPFPTMITTKKKKQQIVRGIPQQVLLPMSSVGIPHHAQPTVFSCASSSYPATTGVVQTRVLTATRQVYTPNGSGVKLICQDDLVQSPQMRAGSTDSLQSPASNQSMDSNDDSDSIVLKQQLQIEELQRKLEQSRIELQQAQALQQVQQKQTVTHSLPRQVMVGPNGEDTQFHDFGHHPPLTQPPPVMSQLQGPVSSPPTSIPHLTSSQEKIVTQAHLFIQPYTTTITSTKGHNCSSVVKQTLANFLLQNGSTHRVHSGCTGYTSLTSTTTQSSTATSTNMEKIATINKSGAVSNNTVNRLVYN